MYIYIQTQRGRFTSFARLHLPTLNTHHTEKPAPHLQNQTVWVLYPNSAASPLGCVYVYVGGGIDADEEAAAVVADRPARASQFSGTGRRRAARTRSEEAEPAEADRPEV